MKKYYFNDGTSQQGPFTPEELKEKNITAETPVWYDGLPDWTTAGQVEELKDIFVHTPPPFHGTVKPAVEEVKPSTPTAASNTQTATVAATAKATAAPAQSSKKSTAWLSYVLALLVVGGVGYLVYQDMEKNKKNGTATTQTSLLTDSTSTTAMDQPTEEPSTTASSAKNDTVGTETTTEPATTTTTVTTETVSSTPLTTEPAAVTTSKTTTGTPATKPDAATIKAQKEEAQKLAQKKIVENKKKLLAAQAAAALKEKEYRNNWSRYITVGKLDYNTKGDGVDAFNIPVFNGTNATLDNVTLRVEYMKKEKKVVNKETIVISSIAPGTTGYGRAPEYKRGNNIKVIITSISSSKLHFCYPANYRNPADPYFCN